MEFSDEEGAILVKLARKAIETYLKGSIVLKPSKELDDKFYQKMGVFVTLNKLFQDKKELRGCIGHPYPETRLVEAVIGSAVSAAVNDTRFEEVSLEELESIVIEVSVLTPPEIFSVKSPRDIPKYVNVGEDGLIVKWRFGSGLLLPQVAVEYLWNAEDFLSQTCIKAGATPDLWLSGDVKVYKFKAIIFDEKAPNGMVTRRENKGDYH